MTEKYLLLESLQNPQLPEVLYKARNDVVNSVHLNSEAPESEKLITDWLEDSGWDALVGEQSIQTYAVDFSQLKDYLNDDEFIAGWLGENQLITDEMRIAHAKMLIAQAATGDDGYLCPSIYSYPIEDGQGLTAVIGCVMPMMGQGGPEANWWGSFKSHEDFLANLKNNQLIPYEMLDDLSDSEILSFWSK